MAAAGVAPALAGVAAPAFAGGMAQSKRRDLGALAGLGWMRGGEAEAEAAADDAAAGAAGAPIDVAAAAGTVSMRLLSGLPSFCAASSAAAVTDCSVDPGAASIFRCVVKGESASSALDALLLVCALLASSW